MIRSLSEDEVRRRVLAWLLIGGLLATSMLWPRPAPSFHESPEVLRVRRIEIVDGAGNIRLRFGVTVDGAPSVRFYDAAGIRRLELAVPDGGPGVTVFDAQGKERQMLIAPPGLLETETLSEDGRKGP